MVQQQILLWNIVAKIYGAGTSLVAQRLRIRLPMQGTRVRALVWEDPTYRGATRPVRHNYWAYALEPVLRSKRSHCNEKPVNRKEKSMHRNEDWPRSLQLESAATKTQWSQKINKFSKNSTGLQLKSKAGARKIWTCSSFCTDCFGVILRHKIWIWVPISTSVVWGIYLFDLLACLIHVEHSSI